MRKAREFTTVAETLRGVEHAFRGMLENNGVTVLSCDTVSAGETAGVRWDGTRRGMKVTLCMPWVSPEATVSLRDVHMFTASWLHEGWHCMYTNMDVFKEAVKEGLGSLVNCIEDVRIDTLGTKKSGYDNAKALRSERIEDLAQRSALTGWDGQDMDKSMSWSLKAFGLYHNAGYDSPTIEEVWIALSNKQKAQWLAILDEVRKCRSTKAALELARKLTTKQDEDETPDDDEDDNRDVNPQDTPDDDDEGGDGRDDEGETGDEGGDGVDTETGDDEGDDTDDEGGDGRDDDNETGDDTETGEGGDDDETETGDDEGDDTETKSGDDEGDDETGDDGDDDSDDVSFEGCKDDNRDNPELTGEDVAHLRIDDDESELDGEYDNYTEEKAATALSSHREGTINNRRVRDSGHKQIADNTPVPARLRTIIANMLRSPDKTAVRRYKTQGRFDSRAILRAGTGAPDVFKTRFREEGTNTAVTLLVDCSISMSGVYSGHPRNGKSLQYKAAQFAFALATCIEASGQSCEVFGFGDPVTDEDFLVVDKNGARDTVHIAQCALFPVKTRRERVRAVLGKFDGLAGASGGGTPLSAAMIDATARLVNERASRRILLCLTDGECNTGPLACKIVQRMAWKLGVEIVGIGCGYDCSPSYYDSASFEDVNEMTQGGLKALIDKLNSPSRRLDSVRVA